MQNSPRLIGNRLALVGAVLYFLEWVAIVFIPEVGTERFGDDPGAIDLRPHGSGDLLG